MEPIIKLIQAKKFVGVKEEMSFANNTTPLLWKKFMSQRKEILNSINKDLFSLQIYSPDFFKKFDPQKKFTKWALTEVDNFDAQPKELEGFRIEGGLYAVFHYKGLAGDSSIFQYILGEWLPSSKYILDDRPHFEILGEKYKNNDPDSEEEIWIPIKNK